MIEDDQAAWTYKETTTIGSNGFLWRSLRRGSKSFLKTRKTTQKQHEHNLVVLASKSGNRVLTRYNTIIEDVRKQIQKENEIRGNEAVL